MRTNPCVYAAAAIIAAAMLAGCGSGGGTPDRTAGLPPAVAAAYRSAAAVPPEIVTSNNDFGFNLLRQLRTADAGSNVFVSPISASLCLEIIYNGAGNGTPTQTEMAKALGISGLSTSTLNNDNASLQASLVSADPNVALTVANSLWYYKANSVVQQSFVNLNTQYYGSQLGDLTGAPTNINAWVSAQTNGKITQVVDNSIRDCTAAVVNAVYFKGSWSSPFDPGQTVSDTFTLADGTTAACSMMNRDDVFPYFAGDTFTAVKLPYGTGRYTMTLILPNAGQTVDTVLPELTQANWAAWKPQFTVKQGSVSVPKFTSTYSTDLKAGLSALGMVSVFDPNKADLSLIGPGLFLSKVTHATYLSVDEKGTIAAGVTVGGVGASSAPVDTFTIKLNRPFISIISDENTGDVLFCGAIDRPK
jgi:serine protease inhibitor